MTPYYADDLVTLYHGSMFDVLPELGRFDACITDPPYGTTNLAWDRWPTGWPDAVAEHTDTLWCFGTMRMILARADEFDGWRFGQEIVWLKNAATSMITDRFLRRHENAVHWYRGSWPGQHRALPKVSRTGAPSGTRARPGDDGGPGGDGVFDRHFKPFRPWVDDGTRWMTSVIEAKSEPKRGRLNPTQKPLGVLTPLIQYSVPEGGSVLDPFAGSGSTGIAARHLGRRAVLIEAREEQCEATAARLTKPIEVGFNLEGLTT
ncbi:site-specific DNA-methyltransferase (adenine-specific) [Salana multivorans]|uniref:Methyltransferase n=1 Tax=Salana multivorans TaxID=120377 RepID=A0A3N2DEG8_9MICO|nr:site-specific DNA-methyltransferase [Salana multivorans]ROR97824.1 site-specific DNA-methyltransferase (adenine-specific) [Salana multivorans]